MVLPKEFEDYTRKLMGDELYAKFVSALATTPPTSIRLNPFKRTTPTCDEDDHSDSFNWLGKFQLDAPIPWCHLGYYLHERPSFTLDPLLHAGAYYVQEASSMFIDFILRQLFHEPVTMLDLCAAPGGKTTCAMSALPKGSILYSNEPVHTRANILAENVMKFGNPDIIVTNNYAKDYAKAGMKFDVILTDVPCSGEGMFRKDPNAITEWSPANVEACWKLQRTIVEDIWQCLRPGGILIYSTCTFNAYEDEDNVQWIIDNLDAEPITIKGIKDEWNITGALKGELPVMRFIPGRTKGEGLFMAVLRKNPSQLSQQDERNNSPKKIKGLKVLTHGINAPIVKGKKTIPDISLALASDQNANNYPHVSIDRQTAINYLRREAITLPPDTPRGIVTITYNGYGLGFANNIGNRANNLYPQEWRIKTTHIK